MGNKTVVQISGRKLERDARGRFCQGHKGAGGRPRVPAELKEAFQAAGPRALELLLDILEDEDAAHRDRLRAAEIILDRGYGKPKQAVDLGTEDGDAGGVIFLPLLPED